MILWRTFFFVTYLSYSKKVPCFGIDFAPFENRPATFKHNHLTLIG
jgi:hypothetical protein